MPQAIAYQKFIRTTARKLRLVADLINHQPVDQALTTLQFTRKRAAEVLAKVIKQAQANAVNNLKLNKDTIKINTIIINEGPTFKRWRAVSRGRAHPIMKRTSHIKVIVSGDTAQPPKSDAQPKKPVTKVKKGKTLKTKS